MRICSSEKPGKSFFSSPRLEFLSISLSVILLPLTLKTSVAALRIASSISSMEALVPLGSPSFSDSLSSLGPDCIGTGSEGPLGCWPVPISASFGKFGALPLSPGLLSVIWAVMLLSCTGPAQGSPFPWDVSVTLWEARLLQAPSSSPVDVVAVDLPAFSAASLARSLLSSFLSSGCGSGAVSGFSLRPFLPQRISTLSSRNSTVPIWIAADLLFSSSNRAKPNFRVRSRCTWVTLPKASSSMAFTSCFDTAFGSWAR